MKLFHSDASPYVRKVMIVLHETGQLDDVEVLRVTTTTLQSDPDLVAAGPLARLPTLVLDDGQAIYDSRVINRYLNDRAGADLYPTDGRQWSTLVLEALADGILDSALAMVYEGRLRSEDKQSPDVVEAHWAKVARGVQEIEANWLPHLAGPLDIGVSGVGAMLGYLDLRLDARGWRDRAPGLADWFRDHATRPAMVATAPA